MYEIPELPSDLIDGVLLRERISEGAMGAVFKATQLRLDREVAIKVLNPGMPPTPHS